jgi:hypothetical protein
MNRLLDFDRTFEEWLAEGPSQLSDNTIEDIVNQLHRTEQRRPGRLPRRHDMSRTFVALGGVAAAAVVVVIVGVLGLGLNAQRPGVGGQPSPSPTAEPTATPTVAPTAQDTPSASPPPTNTPDAGLPVGPFEFRDAGDPDIAMTVTIPSAGWNFGQPTFFNKGLERDNMPEAGLLFWSFAAGAEIYVYGDPCRATSTRPDSPVSTPDEMAAALAEQASRNASEPADVTLDGYEGKWITLHVPEDAVFTDCERGKFVMYGTDGDPDGRYAQGPGQIEELWIMDVDGRLVIINAMYRRDTPAPLVEEIRTIVESTTFEAP